MSLTASTINYLMYHLHPPHLNSSLTLYGIQRKWSSRIASKQEKVAAQLQAWQYHRKAFPLLLFFQHFSLHLVMEDIIEMFPFDQRDENAVLLLKIQTFLDLVLYRVTNSKPSQLYPSLTSILVHSKKDKIKHKYKKR